MKTLPLTLIASTFVLVGCGESDLAAQMQRELDKAYAEQAQQNNPFTVTTSDNELVSNLSVNDAQELANTPKPVEVDLISIAQSITQPEPVMVVAEQSITQPVPEVIVPVIVEPKPAPVVVVEVVPEVVPEVVEAFDPDGETIFTFTEFSGKWTPQPGYIDSYSVGNRCFMYTTLDHGIGDIVVDTPYGERTIAMVQQLIGDGPGLEFASAKYNDIQCGNGPANDFGDEDFGECPGRVDQGKNGCGVIGPKWYFDQ